VPEIHLLFLEDDEVIRLIVTEALVEAGFKVTEAGSGEAATELLQGQHGFNLILADVLLPGRFSGVDVARQARALYPDIPIVFLTGRPDLLRVLWTHGRHDSSIPKPYRASEVIAAIWEILLMTSDAEGSAAASPPNDE
jgi:CheY-like chemotaxis protein